MAVVEIAMFHLKCKFTIVDVKFYLLRALAICQSRLAHERPGGSLMCVKIITQSAEKR